MVYDTFVTFMLRHQKCNIARFLPHCITIEFRRIRNGILLVADKIAERHVSTYNILDLGDVSSDLSEVVFSDSHLTHGIFDEGELR